MSIKENDNNILIDNYIDFLLKWTKKVNLISKQTGKKEILILIEESLMLGEQIYSQNIIDAGSGNGILGIPIAIKWAKKMVILVEPNKKKIFFLKSLIEYMQLPNLKLFGVAMLEFFHKYTERDCALISRGFPNNKFLFDITIKKNLKELLIITSINKLKNISMPIEKWQKNQYNIPWRNHLVLFKMENVSRETV